MVRRLFITLTLVSILLASAGLLSAGEESFPNYTGYVNDFTGILSPKIRLIMSSMAQQIETKTTAQIAVVTLSTVKPLTIEQYAVELFERWGIGQKGKDNGVLILMAVSDKKVRIETGYGLEGALPDAVCNQIIYQVMIPEFKKGDFDKGLLRGMIAVADLIAKEYNIELILDKSIPHFTTAAIAPSRGVVLFRFLVYLVLFILFFWILAPTRRRRGGYWYGSGHGGMRGGFGGGFGGFGGGFSGGGGASGGW